MELSLSRRTAGLPLLMVLAAFVLPGWLWVANTHRAHWSTAVSGDYWVDFVTPWGIRGWIVILLFAASGWVAGSIPRDIQVVRQWTQGVIPGIAAAVAVVLGGLPSWGWMMELGLTSVAQSVEFVVLSGGVITLGATAAGLASLYSNAPVGLLAGLGAGGLATWAVWGALL